MADCRSVVSICLITLYRLVENFPESRGNLCFFTHFHVVQRIFEEEKL